MKLRDLHSITAIAAQSVFVAGVLIGIVIGLFRLSDYRMVPTGAVVAFFSRCPSGWESYDVAGRYILGVDEGVGLLSEGLEGYAFVTSGEEGSLRRRIPGYVALNYCTPERENEGEPQQLLRSSP